MVWGNTYDVSMFCFWQCPYKCVLYCASWKSLCMGLIAHACFQLVWGVLNYRTLIVVLPSPVSQPQSTCSENKKPHEVFDLVHLHFFYYLFCGYWMCCSEDGFLYSDLDVEMDPAYLSVLPFFFCSVFSVMEIKCKPVNPILCGNRKYLPLWGSD